MRRNFKQFYERASCRAQQGAALILLVMFIALGITAYTLKVFSPDWIQILQDTNDSNILSDAKAALLGYTLSGASERPGDMPLPDYLSTSESPANYDGTSDGGCMDATKTDGLPLINSGTNMRCLGRLPWQALGMSISNPSQNDSLGYMPWYAVSANLVDPTCLSILNSDTLNMTYTGYVCGGSTLPHPWLTVRDSQGNVLSSRVAVLLILPGKPIGTQARPSSPLGGVANYLDTVTVPATCTAPCVPGTYSNSDLDDDFIMSGGISGSDSTSNDRVLYITIDELMAAVEKRAAGEARSQLIVYKTSKGSFPDAASLGYQGQSCVQGSNSGFLPLPMCHCTGSMCDCTFPATIKFTSDKNYSSNDGSCAYSAKICTCTGAGSCLRTTGSSVRSFVCSGTGTCVSNVTGTFEYTPSSPIDSSSMSIDGSCTLAGTTATCTGAGNVTVDGSASKCTLPNLDADSFPSWFSENGWKHFIYYTKGSLTVGTRPASSLVITVGSSLGSHIRPSSSINDYLDSAENTNGDTIFDAINTTRSSSYNDQSVIVAP
jgi:hypothetical protein